MQYGIQLYSIRDLAETSLTDAITKMAKLGYTSVEFAGFFNHTAKEICEMLNANNIELSGTHSAFDELVDNFEETLAFHKAIGNKFYIIPNYDLRSQEKIDCFVEKVVPLSKRLAAEGITLCFHNHARELVPNTDGSVVFEQLLYRTDLKFELDTYWAFVGMKDPISMMERIKDRIVFIHIKDGDPEGNGKPLGMGNAPIVDVWKKAKEMGVPMVVESETCSPSGVSEAEICIKYLKNLEQGG